ncbi:MAG: M20 family metallo-hydrolase [Actinomycetota bacterium]|nr:M20 family metallo-hydrolase [Actinomycetota bacterium]
MTGAEQLFVDVERLAARLDALAEIGPLEPGGSSRLAFTELDGAGRDLVVTWMRDLGLEITIDGIGNVIATRQGRTEGPPVMTGSHIDTVRTGGRFDGCLGVLAGLEVIETLMDADITTDRPMAVGFFSNEEGARFPPDMMGSLVYVGGMPLEEALDTVGIDGTKVRDELDSIGYLGSSPIPGLSPHAFVELHIEQGPVLEEGGVTIGAVESVQGISWTEIEIVGQSNHAGTTPMRLRHDAGYAAAAVSTFIRGLADEMSGDQVATCGAMTLHPNLVNVIAANATITVDLRNTDDELLQEAEARLARFLEKLASSEGVDVTTRTLARFEPVVFDQTVVGLVEANARALGHSVVRMPSGAGHDAQMMARVAPTGMVFVPSIDGISHNPEERTDLADLRAGANVLLRTLVQLATN